MKKAFAWLEGKGIEYCLHDYRKENVPAEKIKAWIKTLGWEPLLNTKGTTFRQLPRARREGLNAARAAAIMVEYPSAIKRPVIEAGEHLLVGFDPTAYEEALDP